ncbi:MAG: PfkB family carbohydrate kinase [Pyrinomonadaceae bacterium]
MLNVEEAISASFSSKTIAIIGDLVADQFLNGTISRVSREAPVFILRHDMTTTQPGAAANAAANVASLGGNPILIGTVGSDATGDLLLRSLRETGVALDSIVPSSDITTTAKVRVLAGQHYAARQQVIRIDYENSVKLPETVRATLRRKLADVADTLHAIVVSDYNYGAVFDEIFQDARAISERRQIPLIVDSRYRLADLAHATTATPNREEVAEILGENFSHADCEALRTRLRFTALVVTNGNEGMTLFEEGRPPHNIDAIGPKEPVDVTGAGDTVIAAYALGLGSGLDFAEAANLANHAGGLVVMKKGTATVTSNELAESVAALRDSVTSTRAG